MDNHPETIKEIADQLREELKSLPYEIEDRPGIRITKITTEQRYWDTDVYCLEAKQRLLTSLRNGELSWAQEILFMHESIFPTQDIMNSWTAMRSDDNLIPDATIQKPWWDDEGYLKDQKDLDDIDNRRLPSEKVERYLKGSESNT